ncbi:MAG TPA: aminotransferase class I/II-fold pyridoxal phosphate-dependent enzyme [Gemmatimonadaceae bacterium]|nr:aminotransferase class I/II-fold pyridoxal phosphate-dependent enzyme [Gemmatimonadaceae bacterium]
MPTPAARVRLLPEYPLAAIPQRKRDLLARGVDVIDLGAGDADLAPPPAVVEALDRAARDPRMSRYGFGLGLPAFREAIAAWMARRFGLSFDPLEEVVPLIGSKEGIAHTAFGFANPGDVCVIPEPGYLAYLGGSMLADATPHIVALRQPDGFLLELDQLPREILAKTRMVYVNYPNNPTAATAPRDYLERLVRRCRELDALLVYDNAYSELAYEGYRPASIFEVEGARDIAIEFHSLSKTYNMTGWRCGWAVARPELAGVLAKVKSFVDTGAFMAVQAAGIAALESWSEFLPRNLEIFRARRDAAVSAFRANGFACEVPRATMYLWVTLPDGIASAAFAERLMSDEGVIVLPGAAFGAGGEGFFRVSFIVPPERLTEAAARAGRVLMSFGAPIA